MITSSQQLSYANCQRRGHQADPLSKVCIDERCEQHELTCQTCIQQHHSGHRLIRLPEFLQDFESMQFAARNSGIEEPLKRIKSLRIVFNRCMVETQARLTNSMNRLEDINTHLTRLEDQLLTNVGIEAASFKYQHTQNIEALNSDIKRAVDAYLRQTSNNTSQELPLIRRLEVSAIEANRKFQQIAAVVDESVDSILRLYHPFMAGQLLPLNWSSFLKHPQLVVKGSMVTCQHQVALREIDLVLAGLPLERQQRWYVKPHGLRDWIGMGVISGKLAQSVNYRLMLNGDIKDICLIIPSGTRSNIGRNITAGSYPKFGVGDSVIMEFNPELLQLTFKEGEETCTIALDRLEDQEDHYYPFVALQSEQDSAEIGRC